MNKDTQERTHKIKMMYDATFLHCFVDFILEIYIYLEYLLLINRFHSSKPFSSSIFPFVSMIDHPLFSF